MPETRLGICNFCDSSCGIVAEVEGRRILSIRGDADDPFSRGHVCPKATAHAELLADPDRLRRPVRRVGDRWEEATWDDALGAVAGAVTSIQREHGPNAFGLYYGNPVGHSYQTMLALLPLVRMLGSKNVFSSNSVDAHPRMLVSRLLYGNQGLLPVPDIERTTLLVVQGANPIVSNGSVMTAPDMKRRLRAIRERGGSIVVIDPRRTETAAVADAHHFIRPGTDAPFLLAVLHVLFAEGHVAADVRARARGLDALERIAARFPPERVAARTGIDAATIAALARRFAAAPSAVWYGRMGVSTQEFGCLSTWLIDAINVVTGNLDRAGGAMFPAPAVDLAAIGALLGETGHFGRWRSRVGGLPEFNGEFPVAALADEVETPGPGQLRGLLTVAGNPVLSNPNGRRVDRALAQLEFLACVDFYVNETTRHADWILPPATPVEGDHYPMLELAMAVRNVAHFAAPLVAPEPGARHDWRILLDLGRAVARRRGGTARLAAAGLALLARGIGSGRVLDLMLRTGPWRLRLRDLRAAPHGIDLGPLAPRLAKVIRTGDRKVDLAPDALVADLPRLEATLAPGGPPERGFLLVSRRTLRSMNSWLHNAPRMVSGRNRCTLLVHPDDAARVGLAAGDTARVESRVGAIEVPVEISADVMPGTVSLPYGWGHDREGTGLRVARRHAVASLNDVADERAFDHVSGTSVVDGIPVAVGRSAPRAPA